MGFAPRIGETRAGEWVSLLRAKDEASARRLGTLLGGLYDAYQIDVLTPQGRELPINIPSRMGHETTTSPFGA